MHVFTGLWALYLWCMYLSSSTFDPSTCMFYVHMYDARPVHLWSWSLILMHACRYDTCIYDAPEILSPTDGRTNEPTDKAILLVGCTLWSMFNPKRTKTGSLSDIPWKVKLLAFRPTLGRLGKYYFVLLPFLPFLPFLPICPFALLPLCPFALLPFLPFLPFCSFDVLLFLPLCYFVFYFLRIVSAFCCFIALLTFKLSLLGFRFIWKSFSCENSVFLWAF